MSTIRTPEDEQDKPGYFLPPFTPDWWYQGATYPGHSSGSVDWNRRTKTGGWLDDTGDPVLAAADGTVAEVDPRNGLVMLSHRGGYATEYRHMTGPFPKVGQKVQRGDRIGSIGDVAGDGRSIGAHLHHVHYRNGKRIQQSFYGEPVRVSVLGSDSKPASWKAPDPVMVQGPPPRATWESAFREAKRLLDKAEKAAADAITAKGAAESALADEKAAHLLTQQALDAANERIKELEGEPHGVPVDTIPMEFSYADYAVIDGFATLPDGTRVASTSDVVRVPVLSTAA